MKHRIAVLTIILMTHYATTASSMCKSNSDFSETQTEITSTNDYLELYGKYIENAAENIVPENKIEHNGFAYFSNVHGLFVQRKNATVATKINEFPPYTNIFLDKNFNNIYFATNQGLSVSECGGGENAIKISVADGIDIDFGVVDNLGNVYFGRHGDNTEQSDELYVLRKPDQLLVKISGIEQSIGSYTIESLNNPNKIAVDTKNNVYVGAYTGHIYLIEPGHTTATKLKDLKSSGGVTSVVVDGKDNVYFRTNHALYTLKNSEKKFTKIFELTDDFNYFLWIDKSDHLYFQVLSKTYVLKPKDVNAVEIDKIFNSNGFATTKFTNLQNFQVKNNILYFTSTLNGKEVICALKPNETRLTEIHTTDTSILSLAIDNSKNIYFVAFSDELQKLVPFVLRKDSNIPIQIRDVSGHLSTIFSDNQNNIFFGSGNGLHILQADEVKPFKLRATESQVSSFVVDKSDNVYFATDYDGAFVLKSRELEAIKIDGINSKYGSYVEVYGDRKYDVIYFKSGGALYKLNGGETFVKTIVEGYSPDLYLTNCVNDTYFVKPNNEDSSILSVKYREIKETHLTDVVGQVLYMNFDSFNNLFFITNNHDQLQVLRPNERKPIILAENQKLSSLNVDGEDNVYFLADGEVYVLRSGEIKSTKINNVYGEFNYFVRNGDDILVVTAKSDVEKGLFLIRNKVQLDTTFKNRYLGEIDNNEDEIIFSILNYLNVMDNYLLSKSKNEIINKTPTSATVVATKGKFSGSFNVTYTIKDKDDKNVRNFKLMELLEKAIYFDHLNHNLYNFKNHEAIQDISISTENLKFVSVQVTTNSESISSVEFKNICFNKKRVANTSPLSQTIKVPECNYTTKEIISFQTTTGLSKIDKNIEDSTASSLNSHDENGILNFLNVNNHQDAKAKVTLSSAFDLSNLNMHNHEIDLHNFLEDEQDIIVPPKQRILVNYSVRTFVSETNLILKQKIKGTLVAKIRHTTSEETVVQITIKEAMQTLKKFNLLPSDITINQDNSITFNGRANLIMKRESDPKIIRNFNDI